MTKQEKQTIKQLRKNKDYEEIYRQFGQKEFVKSVDRKYKEEDIKKLMYEGKFEAIYLRYGAKTYNRKLREYKQREIEQIYGKSSIQAIMGRIKLAGVAMLTSIGIGIGTGAFIEGSAITGYAINEYIEAANTTIENAEEYREKTKIGYEKEIEQYMKSIENYADYVKVLQLTDLETIMKVQEDMWATIEGYKTPEIDIEACFGLDIGISKKGVCRNMADDVAMKMNAINPKYNARVCSVFVNENVVVEERTNIERRSFEIQDLPSYNEELIIKRPDYVEWGEFFSANHAVVLIDIKKDNLTLIIDPTSTLIGIFQDGKIHILNVRETEQDRMQERRPWADLFWRDDISTFDIPKEYIKSFLPAKLSQSEIEEKYGIKAQNEALESASRKEQEYIYNLSKQDKGFKESLQINSTQNIYTVEEIKNTYQKIMQVEEQNVTKEQERQIVEDYYKLDTSVYYYNVKKEELLGAQILNPSMRLQAKVGIDMDNLEEKMRTIVNREKPKEEYMDAVPIIGRHITPAERQEKLEPPIER